MIFFLILCHSGISLSFSYWKKGATTRNESCYFCLGKHIIKSMEGSCGSSYRSSGQKASELETLQKQHEEKTRKIQELRSQIESVKLHLKKKRKKEVSEEKKESFKNLSVKYNSLRDEYNALLSENSRE
ncbi:hypothetical protein MANES_14G004800v8 [Manihot esculenta]|uniref:Uncharacterized protein n=1 Tax=Manihot esculenta TaxID=3983 RepID=A0ACB7GDJ3_MANES|nr:hypothetical protein MANES_14G004800v8 [Manihot esculenta]